MDHDRAASHWDTQHFDPVFLRAEWSFHPHAKARLHARLGGVKTREEWFHNTYLAGRTGLRALGIGVGRAQSEIQLLSLGGIDSYDLYDLSQISLNDAKDQAQKSGVLSKTQFHCEDFHLADVPFAHYDLITFIASLHHIEDLHGVLNKCVHALAPNGLIWAAEYIGPDRFDFPPEHTELAKRLYRALDPALKKGHEPELRFPSVQEVIEVDPTESVHSSGIVDVMSAVFPDLEIIPTYGTFMFILSWCLNHDAWYDTEQGREFFQTILDIDAALLDSGQLPHYFAYLIGRKAPEVDL